MRDLFPADWKPKIKKLMLGFDARVDSGLFRGYTGLRESYERFSTFMDRFHVAGWRALAQRDRLGRRHAWAPPAPF